MPKAKQKDLEDLHGTLCEALKKALAGDEEAPPASVLTATRQYLSDNGIEADIQPGDPEEFLRGDENEPEFDRDDGEAHFAKRGDEPAKGEA